MEINESREKKMRFASASINSAKSGIRFARHNLDTLNMGNDPKENEDSTADPAEYMNQKEKRLWNQLSEQKKNFYISKGTQAGGNKLKGSLYSEELSEKEQSEEFGRLKWSQKQMSAKSTDCQAQKERNLVHAKNANAEKKQQGKEAWNRGLKEQTDINRAKAGGKSGGTSVSNVAGNSGTNMAASGSLSGTGTPSAGTASVGTTSAGTASTGTASVGTASVGTASAEAASGAAGGAAGIAAAAARKTAESFKNAVEAHAISANHQIQQRADAMRTESALSDSPIVKGGTAIAAVFLAAASLLMQMVTTLIVSLLAPIIFIIIFILVIVTVIAVLVSVIASILTSSSSGNGAERIVQVALAEEGTTDGSQYWEYVMGSRFVNGSATPWCACFVSWCANECGYIDDGIFPKTASVAVYKSYYSERNLYHEAEGYTPQQGDLIIFGGTSHIGIVQYSEGGRVITIEGNTSDAVHSRSYSLSSPYITGYCTPEYPEGTVIEIPVGMGTYHTYMGWRTITSRTSLQYRLREESGEHYDAEGFAIIDGRYVIACTTTFGNVGDYVDFYREDGNVIHAIIGDIKNRNDSGCNAYGHANGRCVVEYIVQQSTWYPSHANPGTSGCHPEWNSRVVKAVNLGRNYFD